MRLSIVFILSLMAAPVAMAEPQSLIYYGDEQGIAGHANSGYPATAPQSSNRGHQQSTHGIEQQYTGEAPHNWNLVNAWPKRIYSPDTSIRQEQLNNKYPD